MTEYHSYGTSLGCISRRLFVMWVCYAMIILIAVRCLRWMSGTTFVDEVFGLEVPEAMQGCMGLQCYEVFTCYGMRASTYHIREPLCSITGLVFFSMGAIACHHGYRDRLRALAAYLTCYAILQTVCVIGDMIYIYSCNAYSVSVVDGTLLSTFSRVLPAAQEQLQRMNYFPKPMVDNLTEGYETSFFYAVRYGLWSIFLLYAAYEAVLLGMLAERGPLGIGVHYGLDQWGESLAKEAIMHRRAREMPSPFIEDAKIPEPKDAEAPFGYYAGHGSYGTLNETQRKKFGRMVGKGASLDEWSSHRRMHHASPEAVPKYAEHYKRAEGKDLQDKLDNHEEDDEEPEAFRSELDVGLLEGNDALLDPASELDNAVALPPPGSSIAPAYASQAAFASTPSSFRPAVVSQQSIKSSSLPVIQGSLPPGGLPSMPPPGSSLPGPPPAGASPETNFVMSSSRSQGNTPTHSNAAAQENPFGIRAPRPA
mmetsp:Transcript_64872/g.154899  ORF Transcript_64872/g.154899 Transcript_64872/m.154899 type:complete len:481 (-) Transcript_64872:146-1588(-)|eukprot:CAMPEP_0178423992 /NCGR_PEP_ID=MMETSP0689_2-20121128/27979_1 /TAXON_ID=160604 /ORGANISM="Amphidinium massartii, Strain CS-259" /LENGTH=480 /DNA_ID=CAMNT_0020045613 /DNA_START=79 /DNA_END=1521 /DNA_ORIENTATION=+